MGLVSYESSDEEVDDVEVNETQEPSKLSLSHEKTADKISEKPDTAENVQTQKPQLASPPLPASAPSFNASPQQTTTSTPTGPTMGPALGPSRPGPDPSADSMPAYNSLPEASPEPDPDRPPPRSPYSATRAALRDLTLPPVPDLAIPASPPGTPPPTLAPLTRRLDGFLELKRTRGVHFNERLAGSAGLRNPAIMDKLLGFVGVDAGFGGDTGVKQYESTLPPAMWDPRAFPGWAYRGPLRKTQEKAHARARGERVEFVAPGRSDSPSVAPVTGKRKSRFDT